MIITSACQVWSRERAGTSTTNFVQLYHVTEYHVTTQIDITCSYADCTNTEAINLGANVPLSFYKNKTLTYTIATGDSSLTYKIFSDYCKASLESSDEQT